jgi:hypothetical protein
VRFGQNVETSVQAVGGALDLTATAGDASLGYLQAASMTVNAAGTVLLNGTLNSSGPVAITGASVRGVQGRGALNVGSGSTTSIIATSGDIGRGPGAIVGQPDRDSIITLLDATGQGSGGLAVDFQGGHSAWFAVTTKDQFQGLAVLEAAGLNSSTFGCTVDACFNILGQTTSLADSAIANILNAAAQDAANAAFGTENLDVAIRKGYVTTIGRVPPGIDEIAGDLGSSQCDSRVTSSKSIAADKACPVKAK